MRNKAYIIVIQKGGLIDLFDYPALHKKITTANGVVSWWHYIDNTYILITENAVSSADITAFIRKHAPQKIFFVSEINLATHNGYLPKKAWDWIKKHINITHRYPSL